MASVFVTVGSTSFDALISAVCSEEVIDILLSKGYRRLILQIGNGSYKPNPHHVMKIDSYSFKKGIDEDISASSLIISHAGSGSILETLNNEKPLVVVINENLMDNHQEELAQALAEDSYLKYCYCRTLAKTLKDLNLNELRKYPSADPYKFINYLDNIMGYEH